MSDKTCVNMTSFTAHQSLIILVIKKKGLNLHDYLKLRLTAASFIPLSAVKKIRFQWKCSSGLFLKMKHVDKENFAFLSFSLWKSLCIRCKQKHV